MRSFDFLCMLPLAVAQSSSEDSAIYALSVLMMTSCFHIMGPVGQNQARRYVSSSSSGGGTSQMS